MLTSPRARFDDIVLIELVFLFFLPWSHEVFFFRHYVISENISPAPPRSVLTSAVFLDLPLFFAATLADPPNADDVSAWPRCFAHNLSPALSTSSP